jgi:mannose-6-phosphate isomerase-like protein (cupin superfamily)
MLLQTTRTTSFQGLTTRVLLGAEQTAGAYALLEHELAPRALGSPLHAHAREDEVSHVVAGRLGAQVGDAVLEAGPGETVVKPRGVAHAFWNPGDEPVRFLEVITPGGFERYFEEVEPVLDVPGAPDLATLGAIVARFGLDMRPESIPVLMARHGLGCQAS